MNRENDSNNDIDEMIAKADAVYSISEERIRSIIETSFEKAEGLARMIV